ncbi:hypothetical protein HWV23_15505 [Natronomonas halophila]|uniref:hypothetical protein n=1 Tax=Natronomonas halophila TaxID=2747817 RepID=UPI0015B6671C|nr:hypothetical protein [Natronomonas halophila]QLD87069.1 hypothetical protein HWV23_15505 [Natronomonas halophila]
MLETRRERLGALLVVGCLIGVVLFGAGTIPSVDVTTDYESRVGERVQVAGTVVDTDPVRIDHEGVVLTVVGAESSTDEPIKRGDHLVVYGTVEPDRTIAAHNIVVRSSWEFQYLYGVSLVGALWVLGRFLRGWRLDVSRLAFEPRQAGEEETN